MNTEPNDNSSNVGQALEFPKNFLWGTATSAHQVEGHNSNNDWWEWERLGGKIADGTASGAACDHYNRYEEDFDLIKRFGHTTHRFSIEWSRVEPKEKEFSSEAIAHYRNVLVALRERGIEPMVTLHHFTNPIWLSRQGGWANPKVVECFAKYAKFVADELGPLVRMWVTINEPLVYAVLGYVEGIWPPGSKSFLNAARVMKNMVRAHAVAYHLIHDSCTENECSVGIAKHIRIADPLRTGHWGDKALARLMDAIINWWFLNAIDSGKLAWPIGMGQRVGAAANTQDFIGLNYYSRDMIRFDAFRPQSLFIQRLSYPGCQTNDLGWESFPQGLYRALTHLARYGKPIYITENGCATSDDSLRQSYLRDHLVEIHRAISDGIDVRGYYHWSLMDNFEWAEGLRPRYGLVEVDYATQARRPRPSAWTYARVAGENKLVPEWFG